MSVREELQAQRRRTAGGISIPRSSLESFEQNGTELSLVPRLQARRSSVAFMSSPYALPPLLVLSSRQPMLFSSRFHHLPSRPSSIAPDTRLITSRRPSPPSSTNSKSKPPSRTESFS